MLINIPGLVVREKSLNEADRLLTVLTGQRGIIQVFANGVKRSRSRHAGAASLLCYSHFTLYYSRDTYKLNEAETIRSFYELRQNLNALALAQYLCELADFFCAREQDCEPVLQLVLNALHVLTQGKKDPNLIKAAVELRLLTLEGYLPDLRGCTGCGAGQGPQFLNTENGCLLCASCAAGKPAAIALPAGTLAAMRHIIGAEAKRVFAFELGGPAAGALAQTAEQVLLAQAGKEFNSLHFLRGL